MSDQDGLNLTLRITVVSSQHFSRQWFVYNDRLSYVSLDEQIRRLDELVSHGYVERKKQIWGGYKYRLTQKGLDVRMRQEIFYTVW